MRRSPRCESSYRPCRKQSFAAFPPRRIRHSKLTHCGTTRDADTKDLLWCARVTRPVSGSKTFLRHTLSSTIDNSTKETLTLVSARVQMSAFSLPPPAIELTRRLRQGSGAVSAVVQEAARGEAVRAVGAHSSSPRPMVRLVGLLRGATARRESIVASCAAGVGVNHAARHVLVRALL